MQSTPTVVNANISIIIWVLQKIFLEQIGTNCVLNIGIENFRQAENVGAKCEANTNS